MQIEEILKKTAQREASDVFLISGRPISYKVQGRICTLDDEKLMPTVLDQYIKEIYELASNRDEEALLRTGDDDFSFAIRGLARFRVSTFKQRGSLAAVIRIIAFRLPDASELADTGTDSSHGRLWQGNGAGHGCCGQWKVHNSGLCD